MSVFVSRTRLTPVPKANLVARLNHTLGWTEWAGMDSVRILTPGSAGEGSPGEIRQFTADGTTGTEEVLPPEGDRVLRYRLLKGLPLRNYVGEVEVVDEGSQRRVTWMANFDPPLPFTGWLVRRSLLPYFDRWLNGLVDAEEQRLASQTAANAA